MSTSTSGDTRGHLLRSRGKQLLPGLFVVGMSLGPIYLLPSGLPQLGDWILATWALLTLVTRGRVASRSLKSAPLQLAGILVTYITLISLIWAVYLAELGVAFQSLFYIFNFLIIWSLAAAVRNTEERWDTVLCNVLVLATFVLLIMFLLHFEPGRSRQTAGFNNPNQLAYYSLLIFCSAFVMLGRRQRDSLRLFFVTGVTGLMVLFSSSLAAGAGLLIAVVGGAISIGARRIVRSIPLVLVVGLFLSGILLPSGLPGLYNQLISQVQARLSVADQKVDNLVDERGYTRILDYPEYLLFGAAEGARYRFGVQHVNELHSSLGTLLFSYGVPGLTAFVAMLWYVLRRKRLSLWFLTAAPLVYSLTHQGLRTTLFWIFLTVVWIYGVEKRESPSKAQDSKGSCIYSLDSKPELLG